MNINSLMQKAQKMQKEYQKKLEQFEAKEFEYDYQNGSVVVKIKGNLEIVSLTINKALIDPEDVVTLQEMVTEAINNVIALVNEQKEELAPAGGGLM